MVRYRDDLHSFVMRYAFETAFGLLHARRLCPRSTQGEKNGLTAASGGFTVDVEWQNGKVTKATIHSKTGTDTVVRAGSWRKNIRLRKGESIDIRP